MFRFYLILWFKWAVRLSISTAIYGATFALGVVSFVYIKKGLPSLDIEVQEALLDIWIFWFLIVVNIALLLALFHSVKHIFNRCHNSYILELISCENSTTIVENIGYGDLVKVWRKWFMLLIWFSGVEMIIAVVFNVAFSDGESIFAWFNSYMLYFFILISGFFSFVVLGAKCKLVRLSRC